MGEEVAFAGERTGETRPIFPGKGEEAVEMFITDLETRGAIKSAGKLREALERRRNRIRAGLPPFLLAKPCERCNGAGMLIDGPRLVPVGNQLQLISCPDCNAGQEFHRQQVENLRGGSGLEEFSEVTFINLKPTDAQEAVWQRCMRWTNFPEPPWLWLIGSYSSGKSTAARCIGNWWLQQGKGVVFREEPRMMDELRDCYDKRSDFSFQAMFDVILDAPCLIIDDYGKAKGTDWVEEKRFTLTSHRLERGLPTIVTTNLRMEDLDTFQPRLAARIVDHANVSIMSFPEMRYIDQLKDMNRLVKDGWEKVDGKSL